MRIDRRKALALFGLGATPAMAQQAPKPIDAAPAADAAVDPSQPVLEVAPPTTLYRWGVASGDPLQDRVVIWTRVSLSGGDVPVHWEMATDRTFKRIVRRGRSVAEQARDWTVKVDVDGLRPGTEYFYRFWIPYPEKGRESPIGRTRTLPAGPTQDVVLAVASCTLYPNGYFNAYRAIADLPRVDAVLHLGDYIYEYGGEGSYGMNSAVAGERPHDPPREIVSLEDYRRRHAQYKADPDSQAAHARAPWIVAWDDHETTNDSFLHGAQNHDPDKGEGDWTARKAAALKAYYEWMPIREPAPGQTLVDAAARSFRFGDLAQLIMVETRLSVRDQQLSLERDLPVKDGQPDVAAFRAKLMDPKRRLIGPEQAAWIGRELAASVKAGHAWQVFGNQVIMARIDQPMAKVLTPDEAARTQPAALRRIRQRDRATELGLPSALDMWDGYPVDRQRFYGLLDQAKARAIVLSGDSHSFWANDLRDDMGRRVATEFGTTGITSPGAGHLYDGFDFGEVIARANKEVVYNNQVDRGFLLLTLTREAATAEMIGVSTITSRQFTARPVKRFRVTPQGTGVSEVAEG